MIVKVTFTIKPIPSNLASNFFYENETNVYYNYALKFSEQYFPFIHKDLVVNNSSSGGASNGKITIYNDNEWIELVLDSNFSNVIKDLLKKSNGTIGLKKTTGSSDLNVSFDGGLKKLHLRFGDFDGSNLNDMIQKFKKVKLVRPLSDRVEFGLDEYIEGISHHGQALLKTDLNVGGLVIGGGENSFKVWPGATLASTM